MTAPMFAVVHSYTKSHYEIIIIMIVFAIKSEHMFLVVVTVGKHVNTLYNCLDLV